MPTVSGFIGAVIVIAAFVLAVVVSARRDQATG